MIGEARRLAAEQPYRERRWELLMLALYRAGRQAESLEVNAEARRLLIDELGLEPGPALRRMQHAVLAQDPELELASQPSAEPGGDFTSAIPGAATRLIGRAVERRELQEVWTRTQLATLVGPAGAGKTRLALDAARQAGHTLDNTDPSALAAARSRYIQVVLTRADGLARRLGSAERGATLRLLDREMPHVRSVLGDVCAPAIAPTLATTALETAVGLSDYWLGRHPAEGLNWLGRLIDTAQPSKKLRAEAQLQRAHLAYWTTEFDAGTAIADEARAEFAALGHRLGEGRALRRLGAIAAATDDLPAAHRYFEASLARLDEAGLASETGTTLLPFRLTARRRRHRRCRLIGIAALAGDRDPERRSPRTRARPRLTEPGALESGAARGSAANRSRGTPPVP